MKEGKKKEIRKMKKSERMQSREGKMEKGGYDRKKVFKKTF